ncbi:MAG TPA: hypothetical protein VGK53_21640, partial [Propionicimonas sp.]
MAAASHTSGTRDDASTSQKATAGAAPAPQAVPEPEHQAVAEDRQQDGGCRESESPDIEPSDECRRKGVGEGTEAGEAPVGNDLAQQAEGH